PGVYRSTASYQTASDANLPRLSARLLEQLFRVDDRAGGDRFAAEHARDLGDALVVLVEPADARTRVAGGVFFPDVEMRRAEAGDLRQVRDADDLIPGGELLQFAADDFRNAAADAGVDLIEDERRGGGARRCFEERGGDRELNARQLAARRDLLHRLRLFAAIRRDENVDAIEALFAERDRSVVGREARIGIGGGAERDADGRALHGEIVELRLNRGLKSARRFRARARQDRKST